jgi:hypothetical protein
MDAVWESFSGPDASLTLAGSYDTEILSRWMPPASTAFILVVTWNRSDA